MEFYSQGPCHQRELNCFKGTQFELHQKNDEIHETYKINNWITPQIEEKAARKIQNFIKERLQKKTIKRLMKSIQDKKGVNIDKSVRELMENKQRVTKLEGVIQQTMKSNIRAKHVTFTGEKLHTDQSDQKS